MNKIKSDAIIGILFLMTLVLFTDCKKKDEPTIPAFTVISTTVPLQGGGNGLQFKARCTNNDVKMTKVLITAPGDSLTYTYLLNNQGFSKDQDFDLQASDEAYPKEVGTWKFIFIGNRTSDGEGFTVNGSLTVAK
jgi:hypothetical protein